MGCRRPVLKGVMLSVKASGWTGALVEAVVDATAGGVWGAVASGVRGAAACALPATVSAMTSAPSTASGRWGRMSTGSSGAGDGPLGSRGAFRSAPALGVEQIERRHRELFAKRAPPLEGGLTERPTGELLDGRDR